MTSAHPRSASLDDHARWWLSALPADELYLSRAADGETWSWYASLQFVLQEGSCSDICCLLDTLEHEYSDICATSPFRDMD